MQDGNRGDDTSKAARVGPWATLAATLLLAALARWSALRLPLHSLDPNQFLSGYGVVDNRRLLLGYAGLVMAVLLGPLLVLGMGAIRGTKLPRRSWMVDLEAAPPHGGAVARRAVVLGLGVALLVLFVGPGVAYHPLNGHELVHLGYLNEIEHGRVLNLDTRITYGPLLGYSIWAFMKGFSFDLVGFRLYWNVTAAAGLWATLALARGYLRSRLLWLLLALYLVLHTVARLYLPDSGGVNAGLWGWGNFLRHGWAPLLILGFARPLTRSRSWSLRVALGALTALGADYAQETVSGGIVALGMLLLATGSGRSARALGRDAMLVLAGAGLAVVLTSMPAVMRGGLGDYGSATLEVPRLFLQGGGNQPYPDFLGRDRHGEPAWLGYYLFPGLLLAALGWAWWSYWNGRARPVLLPLTAYACVSYVSTLVRADSLHLLNITAAPILIAFLLADAWHRQAGPNAEASPNPANVAQGFFSPSKLVHRGRRILVPVLLIAPLAMLRPGLSTLAEGFVGRLAHPRPSPPSGWERIPGERGGVWTPPGDWFDSKEWGGRDDPDAAPFIRAATQGRPTYIRGNKASLYYFLADVPSAASYTDLSSQCLTPSAYARLFRELAERPPEMVFLMKDTIGPRPRPENGYRGLGMYHGLEVFQRVDLAPPTGPPFTKP